MKQVRPREKITILRELRKLNNKDLLEISEKTFSSFYENLASSAKVELARRYKKREKK